MYLRIHAGPIRVQIHRPLRILAQAVPAHEAGGGAAVTLGSDTRLVADGALLVILKRHRGYWQRHALIDAIL